MKRIIFKTLLVQFFCTFSILFSAEEVAKDPFAELASKIKPSVVTISSIDRGGSPWGVGTGFVVGSDGIIATNFHVIGERREFFVELADGTLCQPTEILAIDRSLDLALFRINKRNLPPLALGDSRLIEPGQTVLSIGNPLGYGLSVSQGVVAAIRELEFGDGRPMVQVAIPIEAGSSGSPVVNRSAEVIALLSIKSGGAMGFGVPSQSLTALMEELDPIPINEWLTVGMLDHEDWLRPMGGNWRQHAGVISASGMGNGFGGRMICLDKHARLEPPFDLSVEVKLEDESGAAGLVFGSDGNDRHFGFYPTNSSLRLTCFNGPMVFDWNIIETKPSPHYQPGGWNTLEVRFDQGGQIRCMVNGYEIIKTVDFTLKNGWVGFCKFREPRAEFRNFRISPRLSSGSISSEVRQRAYEISQKLIMEEKISVHELEELAQMDSAVQQALIDRAEKLKRASERLIQSAEKVRIAQILNELVQLLENQENKQDGILLRAALLVAELDNPNFLTAHYLKRVNRMAERIATKFPPSASSREKLEVLLDQMFSEYGYHGSTLDFHHRANSYLNEVIDDREGLPITLSLLLMEVGQLIDLPISGLATPGHFLALYREPGKSIDESILIDAFGGKMISREQANQLTNKELTDDDLLPATEKEIISRILNNLLRSAEWDRDVPASLRYLDALVAINPKDQYIRTLRAMTLYGVGRFEESLSDINFLIGQSPENPNNEALLEIKRRLSDPH